MQGLMVNMFDDEFMKRVDLYKKAVEENVNTLKMRPMKGRVYVQLMPFFNARGKLYYKPDKSRGFERIWFRYGTVLLVGQGVHDVEPGMDVMFNHNYGVKFMGMYNPLAVGKPFDYDDEIRIFRQTPMLQEIEAYVTYDLLGREIQFKSMGQGEPVHGVIIEESAMFGDAVRVRNESTGEEEFILNRWITEGLGDADKQSQGVW